MGRYINNEDLKIKGDYKMKNLLLTFTLLTLIFSSFSLNASEKINILDEKTVVELWQNEQALFVNALPPEMFKQERIPGSVNIPANNPVTFYEKLGEINKDKKIVTYCAHGKCKASEATALFLLSKGFSDVNEYKGGIKGWKSGNYPVEP